MKLSISNIGWDKENDQEMYGRMSRMGFCGLEIAPTRILPDNPYDNNAIAKEWSCDIKEKYGFAITSMQSIWYGKSEKLFGSVSERDYLINYTKKAIDFATAIDCNNLVFGCPKNRIIPANADTEIAISFFREVGDYAASKGTIMAVEANPTIYNTNYINDTISAFELIKKVDSDGFKLNLDVGTMIYNHEDISELVGNVAIINHVHISEPGLAPIEEREIHSELRYILERELYTGFVSIEMGKTDDIFLLEEKMNYVKGIFQ